MLILLYRKDDDFAAAMFEKWIAIWDTLPREGTNRDSSRTGRVLSSMEEQ
jgi:hypothetical protein